MSVDYRWPIDLVIWEIWHRHCRPDKWKEKAFLSSKKTSTPVHKTFAKHFCFPIYTVILPACLIFLPWVNMEANYSFICVELTLWSTHQGFVCLRYLDICQENAHGAWLVVPALQIADFRFIVNSCKIGYVLDKS